MVSIGALIGRASQSKESNIERQTHAQFQHTKNLALISAQNVSPPSIEVTDDEQVSGAQVVQQIQDGDDHGIGHKATDGADLNTIGKREFGSHWAGVHPQDRVKLKPNKYYIVNTDPHDKPGEHWMAIKTAKTRAYIWDSYGRPVKPLVSHLIKNIHHSGFSLGATDLVHHGEQIGYGSEVCGPDSLAFLLTVRDLGIKRARNI